eukprot:s609_g5.t2
MNYHECLKDTLFNNLGGLRAYGVHQVRLGVDGGETSAVAVQLEITLQAHNTLALSPRDATIGKCKHVPPVRPAGRQSTKWMMRSDLMAVLNGIAAVTDLRALHPCIKLWCPVAFQPAHDGRVTHLLPEKDLPGNAALRTQRAARTCRKVWQSALLQRCRFGRLWQPEYVQYVPDLPGSRALGQDGEGILRPWRPAAPPVNTMVLRHYAVSRTDSPTPGSPWAEGPSLQSCVESQEKLSKAAKWAATRLGSGNEAVEAARRHLRDLRSRQSRLCFRATVRFHKETLAFELQELANGHAGGFDDFQAALRAAEADLGQAHGVVEAARKKAHMIKLQQKAGAHKDLEARHCLDLLASSESRDLRVLAGSIQAAAKALGAAHPIVEKGRQEFLQQRHELQRHQWEECVAIHHTLMVEACESQDPEQIEARILASAHSPLGQGHDIVLYGKRYLLWLRRALQREAIEARQTQCASVLRASSGAPAEVEFRRLGRGCKRLKPSKSFPVD